MCVYIYIYIYVNTLLHSTVARLNLQYKSYSGNIYTVCCIPLLFFSTDMTTEVIFFFVALRPNAGHGLLIFEVSRSHTTKHYSQ